MQIVIDISDSLYIKMINMNSDSDTCSFNKSTLVESIQHGTPIPKDNKCKWIHYDYRTICPEEHNINNPYWRIPENRMETLRYCPYCGKEIEIEADKEE